MPKQFAASAHVDERERLDTFTIGDWKPDRINPDTGSPYDEPYEFSLYEPADSAKLMSLQLAARFHPSASDETKFRAVAGVIDYLGSCMRPDEYDMLYELLTSPRSRGMDTGPLFELCEWVLEVTTGRPLAKSSGSPAGRSAGGTRSSAGSRSTARKTPSKRARGRSSQPSG